MRKIKSRNKQSKQTKQTKQTRIRNSRNRNSRIRNSRKVKGGMFSRLIGAVSSMVASAPTSGAAAPPENVKIEGVHAEWYDEIPEINRYISGEPPTWSRMNPKDRYSQLFDKTFDKTFLIYQLMRILFNVYDNVLDPGQLRVIKDNLSHLHFLEIFKDIVTIDNFRNLQRPSQPSSINYKTDEEFYEATKKYQEYFVMQTTVGKLINKYKMAFERYRITPK